jgi:hypothetical protein
MAVENFRLVTPLEKIERQDFPVSDRSILNPNGANPLLDGEFMEFYSANPKVVVRAGGDIPCFVVFAERGRSDTQAVGKVPLLLMGTYIADTLIMDDTAMVHGGPLMVDDVTIDSLTKSGLKHNPLTGSELVVGYVMRLPTANGNKLRFLQTMV